MKITVAVHKRELEQAGIAGMLWGSIKLFPSGGCCMRRSPVTST